MTPRQLWSSVRLIGFRIRSGVETESVGLKGRSDYNMVKGMATLRDSSVGVIEPENGAYEHAASRWMEDSEDAPRGSETVLLVEDERVVREVAGRTLRSQGYTVLEAADGVEALRLAQANLERGVDLLFTDVVMPLMSGRKLADRMRKHFPCIRVLYTSGYPGEAIGNIGLRERGTAFMEKPFTPVQLTRTVRAVLEAQP